MRSSRTAELARLPMVDREKMGWAGQIEGHRETIPMQFVGEALAALSDRPTLRAAILQKAGLAETILAQERSISIQQFATLWSIFADETNDELFLLDRRGMPRGSLTLIGHSVLHCSSFDVGLRRILRFLNILLLDFRADLEVVGESAYLSLTDIRNKQSGFAYATVFTLILGISSWLIDRQIDLNSVDFKSMENDSTPHYRRLLCNNMRFDRPVTRICFDASILRLATCRTEDQLKKFLRDCPGVLLTKYQSRDSLSAQIRDELHRWPPEEWPPFEQLAHMLSTTSSTLRRRLASEGHSYQRIKDSIRQGQAIAQLTKGQKPIVEIAEQLGFSDSSAFYRAFKKWTGATPNIYRLPLDRLSPLL